MMDKECELHEMVGCAICNKTAYEVNSAIWAAKDKADKEAKEAKRAQRAQKRAERQIRREEFKSRLPGEVSQKDRAANPYGGYKAVEATYNHLSPHRTSQKVESTPTARKGPKGQKAPMAQKPVSNTNYWGWGKLG